MSNNNISPITELNKEKEQDKDFKVKEQLYSLLQEITSQVQGIEIAFKEEDYIANITNTTLPEIITSIREGIESLMIKAMNIEASHYYNYDVNYEYMLQLYERRERDHIQKYFELQMRKEEYRKKMEEYMQIEREFEELKAKVKYNNGRFLDNDRKDNEIIILRAENGNIRRVISELEKANQCYKDELMEKDKQIEKCHLSINELGTQLEVAQNELTIISKTKANINAATNNNGNKSQSNLFCKLNPKAKCELCGSIITKLNKISPIEQTLIPLYGNTKAHNQKCNKRTFLYKNKYITNESFITTNGNSNGNINNNNNENINNTNIKPPSIQAYSNKVQANIRHKHKHNGSMNMILEHTHCTNIYGNSNGSYKNYSHSNSKILKTPLNQTTHCPSIAQYNTNNINSLKDFNSPKVPSSSKKTISSIKNSPVAYSNTITKIDQ